MSMSMQTNPPNIKLYISHPSKLNKHFYAVSKGFQIGIFDDWEETKASVNKYSGAIYKKFANISDAKNFILETNDNLQEKSQKNIEISNNNNDNSKKLLTNHKKIKEIYCDGSALNNGSFEAKGGIGIVFGDIEFGEPVPHVYGGKITNNIAELYAIKRVFEMIEKENSQDFFYKIYSDSQYSINSITLWQHKENKQIKNSLLIKEIKTKYEKIRNKCELIYVKGHSISEGNIKADALAKAAVSNGLKRNNYGNSGDLSPAPQKKMHI